MRESTFCMVTAVGMLAGVTLFIAPGAQAMPLAGPALIPALHQQTATQQVRCRGHRCGYVARPRVRYARSSNAWEYSPLNNPYYWGSGVMGGHGHR
jgi:hypothetical protein